MTFMDNSTPDPFAPLSGVNAANASSGTTDWLPIVPAPEEPPELGAIRYKRTPAAARWVYRDANGNPLFAVVRVNKPDGGKDVLPYTYGTLTKAGANGPESRTGWHFRAPGNPTPLYGLDQLAARPAAPVLVVEGEKSADAVAGLFPDYVPVTSQGGALATGKADWPTLAGRDVVIWPDHDAAGVRYALDVAALLAKAGAKSVRVVKVPEDWPDGWDVADDLPEGVTPDYLARMLAEAESCAVASINGAVEMPAGFRMTKRALMFFPAPTERNPEPEAVFVAGTFDVLGVARDAGGDAWGVVLEWHDADGQRHQWAIPRRLVHRPGNEIAEELEDKGLPCGPDARAHDLLKRFVSAVRTDRRLQSVSRAGWHQHGDGAVFVLPNGEAFGQGAENVVMQAEAIPAGDAFRSAGTLDGWRGLAALAVGNDLLVLGISAAFTGPLLELMAEPSGGVHSVGGTRTGKTTKIVMAASVWGPPTAGAQVHTWRGTANGLEGVAAAATDTLLILDEMGQAGGGEVGDVVYMLGNQAGKHRASRSGAARKPATWRVLFLSTGEITLAAKMGESGKRAMAGLESRLVNISADAGAGLGVFQNLHGRPHGAAFADAIRDLAMAHHGHAGRAFLAKLAADRARDPQGLRDILSAMRDGFLRQHVPDDATGQVRSVAARFALIGAAGELARDYGVVPWPEGAALAAAGACFKAWLDDRGGNGAAEDVAAIAQVRAFIEQHGESRFTLLVGAEPAKGEVLQDAPEISRTINRVGYRRRTVDGWEYLIFPEAWKTEVCRGIDWKRAAEAMARRGFLSGYTSRNPAAKLRIPGEGQRRVYRVSDAILSAGDGSDGE